MIAINDGEVNLGDPVMNTADANAIGVLESVVYFEDDVALTTQFNFRKDSDGALTTRLKANLDVLTSAEITTRNTAIALAAAQAANDAAAAALVLLGGDPCP